MVEPAWVWKLHERIPSNVDAGHNAIEQLMSAMTDSRWEGRDAFHIQMAAEEAMVNAVTHGNKQAADKSVEIEFRVSPQTVYMRFCDQGEGFCPANLPDPRDDDHLECPNGRGVMLINEMMNEVTYNKCGNEVTMIKHRSPQ
ncbi:MAG: ATP-binding protein [Pirellulaceae bacterium]|jgi:serine/threonine-protein kinase RsbW